MCYFLVVLLFYSFDQFLVVVLLVLIASKENHWKKNLNQHQLKEYSKVKQHITTKPELVQTFQHAVQNVLAHWMKKIKRFTLLPLTKYNLTPTLLMVFQAKTQSVKRKL